MSTNLHKLLITGSTGLVGSRFLEIYKNDFSIVSIGRSNVDIQIDLTSEEAVQRVIESSDADAVINFAAFTNVDEAEKEKRDTGGEVYTMNVLLPSWISKGCQRSGKKLYHISTDYVFGGDQEDRPYIEEDTPHPVDSWYSQTKYKGEIEILNTFKEKNGFVIIRISYPYSGVYEKKMDVARTVISRLQKKEPYAGISDQKIKPTSVDDIAEALALLIDQEAYGIYHVAGKYPEGYIFPYDFAKKVAVVMELDAFLIRPISFLELSRKRVAPRPKHTWMDTSKIESLGMKFTNIDEALNRFKQQFEITNR